MRYLILTMFIFLTACVPKIAEYGTIQKELKKGVQRTPEGKTVSHIDSGKFIAEKSKGAVVVMIENGFNAYEYSQIKQSFVFSGYDVIFVTDLKGEGKAIFTGDDNKKRVRILTDVRDVNVKRYDALILIGGDAVGRLRYTETRGVGDENESAAVKLLREATREGLYIGSFDKGIILYTAAIDLIRGKKVTVPHEVLDVMRLTGADILYGESGTVKMVLEEKLFSLKNPDNSRKFLKLFIEKMEGGENR